MYMEHNNVYLPTKTRKYVSGVVSVQYQLGFFKALSCLWLRKKSARLKNTGCYFIILYFPTIYTQFHHNPNAIGNKAKYTPVEISEILYFTE